MEGGNQTTLQNVKFNGPALTTGPLRLHHDKDLDMTFDLINQYPEFMKELSVSDFISKGGCPLSKKDIDKQYSILEQAFQ